MSANRNRAKEQAVNKLRINDLIKNAGSKWQPSFTGFLNEQEVCYARTMLHKTDCHCALYGGYKDAVRQIFGVFPLGCEESFPIVALAAHFKGNSVITHRDVLGSLMGLQIARDCIGDILLETDRCCVFVKKSIAPFIFEHWNKIGGIGIRLSNEVDLSMFKPQQYDEIRGTLASIRVDAVVSLITGLSRAKATALICQGTVLLNYQPILSNCKQISENDILTIRGYGKFRFNQEIRQTKKGRIFVSILKYR